MIMMSSKKRLKRYWINYLLSCRTDFDNLKSKMGFKKISLNEPVFFIHLPKTAGTSFRMMLYKKLPQYSIFPNWKDIAQYNGEYPNLEEAKRVLFQKQYTNIRLVNGHYPFALKSLLPDNYQIFIFLREPMSRTISNLVHFKKSKPENENLSLRDIFLKYKNHLSNLQTRFLCDASLTAPMKFYKPGRLDENDLLQAKSHLASCRFVGITEYFEESIKIAEQTIGFKLGASLRKNVSESYNDLIDPSLKSLLEENLELDKKLYQYGLKLFLKQRSLTSKGQ